MFEISANNHRARFDGAPPATDHRIRHWAMRSLMAIGFAAHAMVAGAVVPTPVVTGPIPGDVPGTSPAHNWPFFATHIVMSDYGYVEQEFFFEGTAKRYSSPTGGAPNNTTTAVVASTGHPYKTRLLVRRPTDPAKFNGIAIVEWVNVTNGYDVEIHWQESMAYYIREGYAFIGVSVQNAGVSGQGSPLRGLKAWSPTRYGTLNVNDNGAVGGDLLGYDIFSQAGQAVRNVSSVLGGLPVERVIAKGESQSAQRLHIYFNAIHHLDPVFDGAMITHNDGTIRSDISTPPIMRLYSENEIRNCADHSTGHQHAADLDGGGRHAFRVLHDDRARADPAARSRSAGVRHLRDAGAQPRPVLHGDQCRDRPPGEVDPYRGRAAKRAAAGVRGNSAAPSP